MTASYFHRWPSCVLRTFFDSGFVDFSQVSWYRRQKKLHETDRLLFQTKGSRQTLYIRKVNPTDFGNYSCRAENALGEARTFTELSGLFFQTFIMASTYYFFFQLPQDVPDLPGSPQTPLDIGLTLTTSPGALTALNLSLSTSYSLGDQM